MKEHGMIVLGGGTNCQSLLLGFTIGNDEEAKVRVPLEKKISFVISLVCCFFSLHFATVSIPGQEC